MKEITHVVLLKVKEGISTEQIDSVFAQLRELKGKIPGIVSFKSGPYDSWEGLNQGFNFMFKMVFSTSSHRDDYLPHPEHELVKAEVGKILAYFPDDVVAFDFKTSVPAGRLLSAVEEELENSELPIDYLRDMLKTIENLKRDIEANPQHYMKTVARNLFNEQNKGLIEVGPKSLLKRVAQVMAELNSRISPLQLQNKLS